MFESTADGALALFEELTGAPPAPGAVVVPDPRVPGVFAILDARAEGEERDAVVYVADGDFEMGEMSGMDHFRRAAS